MNEYESLVVIAPKGLDNRPRNDCLPGDPARSVANMFELLESRQTVVAEGAEIGVGSSWMMRVIGRVLSVGLRDSPKGTPSAPLGNAVSNPNRTAG